MPRVLRPVMKEQTTGKLRVASTLPTDDVVRAVQVFPAVLGTPPPAGSVPRDKTASFSFRAREKSDFSHQSRPQIGRDHPLNLSISLSGGKETNQDSLSSGE